MENVFLAAIGDEGYFRDIADAFSNKSVVTNLLLKKLLPGHAKVFKKSTNFGWEYHNWIASQCTSLLGVATIALDASIKRNGDEKPLSTNNSVEMKPAKKRISLVATDTIGKNDPNKEEIIQTKLKAQDFNSLHSSLGKARKMAALYALLAVNNYIPIQWTVQLLSKLVAIPWTDISVWSPAMFENSPFSNISCFCEFIVTCVGQMLPLITKMGPHICSGFAACPPIRVFSPKLFSALNDAAVDNADQQSGALNHDEYVAMALSGNYIRPFREDIDSRLQYNSLAETQVYNEREKMYDTFSNLFHQYQSLYKSDMDGSKVAKFWQTHFLSFIEKMEAMKSCNFPWFAEIFLNMMIFFCLSNQPSQEMPSSSLSSLSSSSSSSITSPSSSSSSSTISRLRLDASSSQQEPSEPAAVFTEENFPSLSSTMMTKPGDPKNASNKIPITLVVGTTTDQAKQRKLEERLGVGGVGGKSHPTVNPKPSQRSVVSASKKVVLSAFVSTASSSSSSVAPAAKTIPCSSSAIPLTTEHAKPFDKYDWPGACFPGCQQFFYRFIVLADNNRFTSNLQEQLGAAIANEMAMGTGSSMFRNTEQQDNEMLGFNATSSPLHSISEFRVVSQEYAEPLSVRILKLRLLGKFLGLIEFWPHWTLDEIDGSQSKSIHASKTAPSSTLPIKKSRSVDIDNLSPAGPLVLQAQERAHKRSLFRKVLPIRQLVEASVNNSTLTLAVPWIVEFLKMMEFDKYLHIENPYKDVMGILFGIQKSDLFHSIRGKLTQNRLFVLHEIHRLWETIGTENVKLIAMNTILQSANQSNIQTPARNRSGSNVSTNSNATVTAAATAVVNASIVAIDDMDNTFTLSFLFHLIPNIHDGWLTMKKLATMSSSQLEMIVEWLISCSSHQSQQEDPSMDSLIPSSYRYEFGNQRSLSISSINGMDSTFFTVGASTELKTPIRSISCNLETASQDIPTSSRKSPSTPTSQILSMKKSAGNGTMSSRRAGKAPSPSNSPSPGMGRMLGPAATAVGPGPAGFGFPMVRSLSTGTIDALSKGASLLLQDSNHEESYLSIEAAFWQQHPQLCQIYCFLIDHIQQSCTAQLRELIAESVRQLWIQVALIKNPEPMNSFQLHSVSSQSRIDAIMRELQSELIKKGDQYLKGFFEIQYKDCFANIFRMYPVHERVTSLAFSLLSKHVVSRRPQLMIYLTSYSSRKFEEVKQLRLKQLSKSCSGASASIVSYGPEGASLGGDLCLSQGIVSNAEPKLAVVPLSISDATTKSDESLANDTIHAVKEGGINSLLTKCHNIQHQIVLSAVQGQTESIVHRCQNALIRLTELHSKICARFMANYSPMTGQSTQSTTLNIRCWLDESFSVTIEPQLFRETSKIFQNKISSKFETLSAFVRTWSVLLVCSSANLAATSSCCSLVFDGCTVSCLARHLHTLISGLLQACQQYIALCVVEKDKTSTRDTLSVIACKFFTASLPSLLYFDFLVDHFRQPPNGSMRLSFSCIAAIKLKLLSESSLARVFVSTTRQSTVTYYESCFGFKQMKTVVEINIVKLLVQYVVSAHPIESDSDILQRILEGSNMENDLKIFSNQLLSRYM